MISQLQIFFSLIVSLAKHLKYIHNMVPNTELWMLILVWYKSELSSQNCWQRTPSLIVLHPQLSSKSHSYSSTNFISSFMLDAEGIYNEGLCRNLSSFHYSEIHEWNCCKVETHCLNLQIWLQTQWLIHRAVHNSIPTECCQFTQPLLKYDLQVFLFQSLNLLPLWGHEAIWACFNITVASMLMGVICESKQIAPKRLTSSKLDYAELL